VRKLRAPDPRDVKALLELKFREFNNTSFIADDPISVPHLFQSKEDREIAGFLAATIAWGQRPVIVKNGMRIATLLNHAPHEFVMNASKKDLNTLKSFVHRTFNGDDLVQFTLLLRELYSNHGSMENVFITSLKKSENMMDAISLFRSEFLKPKHNPHCEKHISDPARGSSAKRINMFLRWMVRKDHTGVDFGIWKKISPIDLIIPLDIHVGNVARHLGLLQRKQDDRKAAEELTEMLRQFDKNDPVKYDFALFSMGITGFVKHQ